MFSWTLRQKASFIFRKQEFQDSSNVEFWKGMRLEAREGTRGPNYMFYLSGKVIWTLSQRQSRGIHRFKQRDDLSSSTFQEGDWLPRMDKSKIGGRENRQKSDAVIYVREEKMAALSKQR